MLFKIAFRNIFRQKRRTILTVLTMFGGFVLSAISIGWSDGTYTTIINMFTRNRLGHIQIHKDDYRKRPTLYKTIKDYTRVGKQFDSLEQVEAWAPRLFSAGLVSVKDKSAGAKIIGIDPELENQATRFNKKIIKGKGFGKPSRQTILGKGLAKVLNAAVGDQIVVVSQAADGSIANDAYSVIGIMESGDEMQDRMAFYLHLKDAQNLLVLYGQVHEIAVIVDQLGHVKPMVDKIKNALNDSSLEVVSWKVFAKSFYQAMQADMQGMWIMLFVIILIVAVGVLNTVLMSVLERTKEYGLLKAMGTKPHQIVGLVIYEVNILAVISVILGAGVGALFNYLLSQQGIALPQAFTYGGIEFTKMYTTVNSKSFYLPAITIVLTASIVGFFPGIKAARNEPAESMRK